MFGLKPRGEQRAIQATPWGEWPGDGGSSTWGGARVDTTSSLQLSTVYGCVRFICEGISTLPVDVLRRQPDGTRTESSRPLWLDQPTPDLDRVSWLTQVLTSLLLDGNAYLKLRRMASNPLEIDELLPLDPKAVSVRRERGSKQYVINGQPTDAFEVLHIPGVMFPGCDVGMSPVEAARQSIGKGMAVEEFSGRFFSQGANLGGVIEDPGDLNPSKAREMARIWARLHSGNRNAHLPGVLQGGAVWKPTAVTPEQAQFLQTQQFNHAQICAFMFQIDPTEFGVSMDKGSSVTYANLEQRNARKVQVTFLPWIVRLENALSSLMQKSRYVKFNVSGLLRADSTSRWANYKTAMEINVAAQATGQPPVQLTKEMRALEDMEPIADDDIPEAPAAPAPAATPQANSLRLVGDEATG